MYICTPQLRIYLYANELKHSVKSVFTNNCHSLNAIIQPFYWYHKTLTS